MRIILLILLFTFCYSIPVESADKAGTTGFQFLKICRGARLSAMGNAYCALIDINNLFGNPSVLSYIENRELSINCNQWIADISEQSISYAYPSGHGVFGVGVTYLYIAGLKGYDVDTYDTPVRIADFSYYDIGGVLSYSRNIKGNFSGGINLKLFEEKIEDEKATGIAFDLGLHREMTQNLMVGFAVQNIGPKVKFIDEYTPLPLNYKLGLVYKKSHVCLIAVDIDKPVDNDYEGSVGVEYEFKSNLTLRMGYKIGNDFRNGISIGVGVKTSDWIVDYALVPYGDMGLTHRISLLRRFGS